MSTAEKIEEQAARWIMRREEPDWSAEEQRLLDAWLAESVANKAAFWRLEFSWGQADRIGALGTNPGHRAWWRVLAPLGATWKPYAIAATVLVAVGAGVTLQRADPPPPMHEIAFSTVLGARKTVSLADGSRIELNTSTRMRASVSQKARQVWLDEGEAYFEVAHAKDRPFVIYAGTRTVTVLGTKFLLRRDGDRLMVSVREGRVRIDKGEVAGTATASVVTDGTIAIAEGSSTLVASDEATKVEDAMAWREGMVTFNRSTLADVATEFNRYNRRKLVIVNNDVAQIRIGGTFQTSNVNAFARLLRDAYHLRIEVNDDEVRISN